MKNYRFSRGLFSNLSPILVLTSLICQSCTAVPLGASDEPNRPARGEARRPPATAVAPRAPVRPPKKVRPDPRYRPPANFTELEAVAGEVARGSRRQIVWHLKHGPNPGPLARITGGINDCTIHLHPIAARTVPPNTWAFIFGHEFAHRIENLGEHGQSNPTNELKADIAGARYAMAAGYRLEAFLGWVLAQPNQVSSSHGSLHDRVRAIGTHFGIPENIIQAEAKRYSTTRAKQ
jgi:hypothetical protein